MKEGERMVDIMAGSFLTKSEGDGSELVWVRFNNGASKPMRHAKKRCLDEIEKWQKSLGRPPTREDWAKSKNPKLFSLASIDEIFGSFEAMLEALAKRKRPPESQFNPTLTVRREAVQESSMEPSEIEGKVKDSMPRGREWTDRQLAEFLHRACGNAQRISVSQYSGWRSNTRGEIPSYTTIANRLGDGKWTDVFPKMRELLNLEEPLETEENVASEGPSRRKTPDELKIYEVVWEWPNVDFQSCLEDVQKVAEILGHQPTKRQYRKLRKAGMQSVESLRAHFGHWPNLMKAAGFDPLVAMNMPYDQRIIVDSSESAAPIQTVDVPHDQEMAEVVNSVPRPKPEKRSDEQCIKDVQDAAAKLSVGESLTTKKYDELRAPGAVSNKALRDRFNCKWHEILILADIVSSEPKPEKPKSEVQPEQSEVKPQVCASVPEPQTASAPIASMLESSSLRLVNLLGYSCRLNYDGLQVVPSAGAPSTMVKEQKTLRTTAPGERETVSEFKIILEWADQEFELPEPSPGVVYLIDASLYEAIPASHRRGDLLPAYQSRDIESDPIGLRVITFVAL